MTTKQVAKWMARQEVPGTADSAFTRFAPRPWVERGLNSWGNVAFCQQEMARKLGFWDLSAKNDGLAERSQELWEFKHQICGYNMIQPICGLLGYTDAIMNIEGSNTDDQQHCSAWRIRDVMMSRFLDAWNFDRYSHLMTRGLGPQKSALALQNGDTQPFQVIFFGCFFDDHDVVKMILIQRLHTGPVVPDIGPSSLGLKTGENWYHFPIGTELSPGSIYIYILYTYPCRWVFLPAGKKCTAVEVMNLDANGQEPIPVPGAPGRWSIWSMIISEEVYVTPQKIGGSFTNKKMTIIGYTGMFCSIPWGIELDLQTGYGVLLGVLPVLVYNLIVRHIAIET